MRIAVMTLPDWSFYLNKGVSYPEFRMQFEKNTAAVKAGEVVDVLHSETLPLNWQRTTRVEKTFHLNDRLRDLLERLDHKITWLVITEAWCGDSAQTLPAISHIADAAHGMIDFKIILRDQHLELMDAFLTNGSRGIPKLIQLDTEGRVTGTWGPRPQEAQNVVTAAKADSNLAANYKEELHKWYAHDHSRALQEEILQLLSGNA
ncbi:MAG: thioredoxin family protein [Bacteroidota bacterium]